MLSLLNYKMLSLKEKTFGAIQNIFKLSDIEVEVFKMFCRNELNDTICDLLCLAHDSAGNCSVRSMCFHYSIALLVLRQWRLKAKEKSGQARLFSLQ